MHIERGEIVADNVHHHGDRLGAHDRQPFRLLHRAQLDAVLRGELCPDRLEIIAGIKAFRDRADVFAERLAVTQESRACEHVDLRACIVDVVFARDLVAGEGKQVCERVAEHRAAAVTDMHGAGRIGRDVFDVDLFAFADVAAAVVRARCENQAQFLDPDIRLQREIDEARARRCRPTPPCRRRADLPRCFRPARAASCRHPSQAPSRHWWPCRHGSGRAAARPQSAKRPRRGPGHGRRRLLHAREHVREQMLGLGVAGALWGCG